MRRHILVASISDPDLYQRLAARTEKKLPTDLERLEHGLKGCVSEIGEIAGALKKHTIYNLPLDLENIREEIGDLLWYVALLADATESDLSVLMADNIAKLKKRYPDRYTDRAAVVRADKADGE